MPGRKQACPISAACWSPATPAIGTASPNNSGTVVPKSSPYDQLLEFLRTRPSDSGIVYCASRKTADSVAAKLNADRIQAKPYHAGLEAKERAQNQEMFLRGVLFHPSQYENLFVSLVTTDEDIDATLTAAADSFKVLAAEAS